MHVIVKGPAELHGPPRFRSVLIDSTHKRWMTATLTVGGIGVAVYLVLAQYMPGGLTGGSSVGLWYGTIGTGLMIYAGLLASPSQAAGAEVDRLAPRLAQRSPLARLAQRRLSGAPTVVSAGAVRWNSFSGWQ